MYSCALRGGTADCQMEQPAVFASLRSVQGAAPLAALCAYPCLPPKGGHPPCVCPPSEGLITEHRHPDRSLGTPRRTVFFSSIFSKGRQHLLHGPPQTGADPHPTLGQGYGAARDFPFPAAGGKMKSVLRDAPRWDKVSQSRGHDLPAPTSGLLSSQRTACQRERGNCDER